MASLPSRSTASIGSVSLALLSRRLKTLTPSPKRALSVGGWTFVSTTIASTLSFLPRVTFNERANSTARSLSAASVSEPIWLAQRMRVVS